MFSPSFGDCAPSCVQCRSPMFVALCEPDFKNPALMLATYECSRKAGISQATYFNWKKKLDGLLPTEMRRLKQLEDENSKLKKLVADLSLDREMLQDVIRRKL